MWWHWSEWTLAQVMACSLAVPSHYQNQCSPMTNGVLWHWPGGSFSGKTEGITIKTRFENYTIAIEAASPRGQCVEIPDLKNGHSGCVLVMHFNPPIQFPFFYTSPTELSLYELCSDRQMPHQASIKVEITGTWFWHILDWWPMIIHTWFEFGGSILKCLSKCIQEVVTGLYTSWQLKCYSK